MSSISSATRAMRENAVSSQDTAIAFDYVQATGAEGIQFDVWYCNTHLPNLAVQHTQMRHYAVPSRTAYAVVAELGDLPHDPIPTDTQLTMVAHHEHFIGEPLGQQHRRDVDDSALEAAVVYPAFLRVPQDQLPALGRWYDEEHTPILLSCPQWLMTRRFRIINAVGLDYTHVALHYLSDLRALQSSARAYARATPWRDQLIAQGWFSPEYRVCYRTQAFPKVALNKSPLTP